MENQERNICRSVSPIEFRGIMCKTIPVCDEFGDFNRQGLALVEKNGKMGVVNTIPQVVIPIEQDYIEFLAEGLILAQRGKEYFLYTNDGMGIIQPELKSKVQALLFAMKFKK